MKPLLPIARRSTNAKCGWNRRLERENNGTGCDGFAYADSGGSTARHWSSPPVKISNACSKNAVGDGVRFPLKQWPWLFPWLHHQRSPLRTEPGPSEAGRLPEQEGSLSTSTTNILTLKFLLLSEIPLYISFLM